MNRKDFISKSACLLAMGGLMVMGCSSHHEKKNIKYTIVSNRCRGCGHCLKACDERAIQLNGDIAIIDQLKCKGCGDCQNSCEKNAIVQA